MAASDPLSAELLDGERDWVTSVVANLLDDDRKLVYADWLEDHGDERSAFLRQYVKALRTMDANDFPPDDWLSEEWLELTGYRLAKLLADAAVPDLKEPAFRLARPALRMVPVDLDDQEIAVGATKIGGLPDLPPAAPWPTGDDCKAIYGTSTAGVDRLAGFLAQVNLAEIALTQAAKDLPKEGVLSFFCYQDIEDDNPDVIGARALYFPDPTRLVRTAPPGPLTEGNRTMPVSRLVLKETLDLPEDDEDGPWGEELSPFATSAHQAVYDHVRRLNFQNLLGYARATTGGDPTPHRQSRHLILLENSVECRLHVQIHEKDLAARNFDAITLSWVDFD